MSELLSSYKCAILVGAIRLRNTIHCTKRLWMSWSTGINAYSFPLLKSEFNSDICIHAVRNPDRETLCLFFSSSFTERNMDDTRMKRSYLSGGPHTMSMSVPMSLMSDNPSFVTIPKMKAVGGDNGRF